MGSNHEHGQHPAWVMISIHAPRMGSDRRNSDNSYTNTIFQSTLPGWGATKESHQYSPLCEISIHAPRMGSDEREEFIWVVAVGISIHAPRMGSDRNESACPQSQEISIHAPRMGSDVACGLTLMVPVVFQSTLPGWGATVLRRYEPVRLSGFQSTLPGWGATRRTVPAGSDARNFNPRSPDGERRPRHRAHALR